MASNQFGKLYLVCELHDMSQKIKFLVKYQFFESLYPFLQVKFFEKESIPLTCILCYLKFHTEMHSILKV